VKPVMVLDIGASTTKAYIVEHGIVQRSHSINAGSQDITRAIAASGNLPLAQAETLKKESAIGDAGGHGSSLELVFGRVFSEAKRVLVQYEMAHEKPVGEIILTGGGSVTKELATYAQSALLITVKV